MLPDLAHAKDASDNSTCSVESFALPAKRQFSRTKTAFGRLQGPISVDQDVQLFKKVQLDDDSELMKA